MHKTIQHDYIDAYSNLSYSITHIIKKLIENTDKDKYYNLITLTLGMYHVTFNRIEDFNNFERYDYLFWAFFEQSLWQAALEAKIDLNGFAIAFQKYSMNIKDYDPTEYDEEELALFLQGSSLDMFSQANNIINDCLKCLHD